MAKIGMERDDVKATKRDLAFHCGRLWKVMEREYDVLERRSFYCLKEYKKRMPEMKWVRSDLFDVI